MASNMSFRDMPTDWRGADNRFSRLADDDDGDNWARVERKKRQRRSTGGTYQPSSVTDTQFKVTKEQFKSFDTDEKLVTLFDLLTSVGNIHGRLNNVENTVNEVQKQCTSNQDRIKLLEYKSIDAESRSRRHNLLFRGIKEAGPDEDCEDLVRKFISEDLNLNGPAMFIQRAHRLGKPRRRKLFRPRDRSEEQDPRPIIACFRDYSDVEILIENSYRLRLTRKGISRDYPKEIVSARSQLWPRYKLEKEKNPQSRVQMGFPAKILINGRIIEDKFPDWFNVLRGSRHYTNSPIQQNVAQNGPSDPSEQMTRENVPAESAPHPQRDPPAARSDTDEDERDISMQMDGSMGENEGESSRDTENPTQHRSVYDEAMEKLSQHVAATQQLPTGTPPPPSDNLANKETVDKPPDDSSNKDSVH